MTGNKDAKSTSAKFPPDFTYRFSSFSSAFPSCQSAGTGRSAYRSFWCAGTPFLPPGGSREPKRLRPTPPSTACHPKPSLRRERPGRKWEGQVSYQGGKLNHVFTKSTAMRLDLEHSIKTTLVTLYFNLRTKHSTRYARHSSASMAADIFHAIP